MEKILFITVFSIALYLSINVIQKFSIKFDLLGEIIKELKLGYIDDIVTSNSTICPRNYESIVTNNYWPGSYKGCGCKNEDKTSFSFYPNYCPKLRECYSVEETNRKEFIFWRGANICFRRSNIDYSIMNVKKKSSNINENNIEALICSNSTHKNCGIIDGKNHYLCMERSKECPINEIKFVKMEGAQINFIINNRTTDNPSSIINKNSDLDNLNVLNQKENEEKIKFDSGFKILELDKNIVLNELDENKEIQTKENLIRKNFDFDMFKKYHDNYSINSDNRDHFHRIISDKDKNKYQVDKKNSKSFEDLKNSKHFEFNLTKLDLVEEEYKKKFITHKKNKSHRNLQSFLVKFTNASFTSYDNSTKNITTSFNRQGFYSLNLSDNYQLIFSKNEMLQIDLPNKVKVIPLFFRTETNKPCLDSLKRPSSEYFFPLMKNKFDYICDDWSDNKTEILDERLEVLDSYSLSDFYKNNNYFKEIEKVTSPFDLDILKKSINLYTRNYLGWSAKCLANSPESLQSFLRIEESLNHLLILNILHSFVSIGGIIALGIFACFLSEYFELFFKFVNLGFCLLNLILPIQILSNSNWIINLFTDEDGVFCGDNTLNILLIEVSNSCLEMQNSYIWILIITIFYSFVYIYILYKWIKPFHQEYQNKFKNYMSIK